MMRSSRIPFVLIAVVFLILGVFISSITAAPGTDPKALKCMLSAKTVADGASVTLTVAGGTPPYRVKSSNTLLTVAGSGPGQYRITGVAPGPGVLTVKDARDPNSIGFANVIVEDAKGGVFTAEVTVTYANPMKAALQSASVGEGKSISLSVTGGTQPLQVTAVPPIARIEKAGQGQYKISTLSAGQTIIRVSDAKGQTISLPLNVTSSGIKVSKGAEVSLERSTISIGRFALLTIKGGVQPYDVTTDSGAVNIAPMGDGKFRIIGVNPGQAILKISNKWGDKSSVAVTVTY